MNIHTSVNMNLNLNLSNKLDFVQEPSLYEFNHLGKIFLPDGKIIETPIIWYGLSVVESVDFQIEVFEKTGINAILSNVYDLLVQDKKARRRELIEHFQLKGFHHKMDSGGFQLMKYELMAKKIPIKLTPELVYETQTQYGCDLAIQLDVPLSPNLTKAEIKQNLDKSISNYIKVLEINEKTSNSLNIMPVVHGYSDSMIEYCVEQIEEVLGNIPIIGIGSLVPLVKRIEGTRKLGGRWKFIDNLIFLRKRLPKSMIHAFGIGGTMSYLAFYCGVDSLDSNGWIQKSAFGVIQLPGISDRFIVKKSHNRPYLQKRREYSRNGKKRIIYEKKLFMECKCPVCIKYHEYKDEKNAWKEKIKLFDDSGQDGRKIRAIHNVSLFNNELKLIRESIKIKKLDKFISKYPRKY